MEAWVWAGVAALGPLLVAAALVAVAVQRTRDATDRLQHTTDHARSLLDALGQPVLVLDERGRVREANAAARGWFGPPDGLPAWLGGRVVLTGTVDDLSPMFGRAGMLEGRVNQVGAPRLVQVTLRPGQLLDGGRAMVCGLVDVTALKLAQEHQAKAAVAEREANRTKSQFLANMSHELRTPLNAILGYTDLLLEDASGAQVEDLHRIHRSGAHLLTLIDQVLDLAKLEAGRMVFQPEPTDVDALLLEVAETLGPLAAKNGNTLEIVARGLGAVLQDPLRLRQVLINLGANACKFTQGGRVSLGGRDDGDGVLLTVSDTGIGIDAADLERLFEPFVQVDGGTNRRFGGTGLGLALARHFVERMGGHIAVDSLRGEGSTFSVRLPRVVPERAVAATAATPPGVPSSTRDTILED